MKKINKLLSILFIIPLLAICFVGCDSNKISQQNIEQNTSNSPDIIVEQNENSPTKTTIKLNEDNIKEYLIFSYEILSYENMLKTREYPTGTFYNTLLYNLKISVTSKVSNLKFNNCSFNFYPIDNPKSYNNVSISINENGVGCNSMLYSYEYLASTYTSKYIETVLQKINEQNYVLKNITGTVTIGE